jgi:hypothetical protein
MRPTSYILKTTLFATYAIIATSCETLPPGEPPEGAIIPEPEMIVPGFNAEKAVNHMVTTLAMRCEPISGASNKPPFVLNRFAVSSSSVNDLPMDVWRKLIRMKLIIPAKEVGAKPEYRLESAINKILKEKKTSTYSWTMTLFDMKGKKSAWRETIEFTKKNQN